MLFAVIYAAITYSQNPQPIYSFATVLQPVEWYKTQADLWKKEIDKNQKNSEAWYNYYRAKRSINRLDTEDKRSAKEEQQEETAIVDAMQQAVPESYEYHLCRWLISGNNYAQVSSLKKADELSAGKTTHYPDMIVWGELERNTERKNMYCQKWIQAGTTSPGLLYYSYNVLVGLKPNAIIFTSGDNDTYPIWILQSQGIRKDVTVLNLSLLFIDEYRKKMFDELGVPTWKKTSEASSMHDMTEESLTSSKYREYIVKHVASNKKQFPVYVGLTVQDDYTKSIAENLYLTGLAYEYNTKAVDNIAHLKRNFEQLYALDYLDKKFFTDISEYWVNMMNANYIVPMVKLYEHYKISGDGSKADALKTKAFNMIKKQPAKDGFIKEEDLKAYFN